MPPAKKKRTAAAVSTLVLPSDAEVVDLTTAPKRSTRKRKQVNYTVPTEIDPDIAEEKPRKSVKSKAKSKVTAAGSKVEKGKKKAPVLVLSDHESEEVEAPKPKPKPAPKKKAPVLVLSDHELEEVEVAKPKPKPAPKKKRKARDDEIEYDGDGEEIRKRDYEDEPCDKFLSNKGRALLHPLQFVNRQRCDMPEAPRETFTIAGSTGSHYTVDIRHVPKCSCMDFVMRRVPCKHIIYTMVKVLKVSETSPLLYQYALTSMELQSIFNNAPAAPHIEVAEEETDPNRKPIEGECPICYMEFEPAKEIITYCKAHCGNNVHRNCMATWLRSQREMYNKGTCPYCRQHWLE